MAIFILLTLLINSLESSSIYELVEGDGPYPDDSSKVNAPFITCWEQDKYTYAGYHDVEYMDNDDYPNYTEGDVCDHTSPITVPPNQFIRNVCRFEVRVADCVNPYNANGGGECLKTWSRKCAIDNEYGSDCPDGWRDAADGCVPVNNGKSIVCCCDTDLCNVYMDKAIDGWADPSNACEFENGKCLGLQNVKIEDEGTENDVNVYLGKSDNGNTDSVKYTVKVLRAHDLADEDEDYLFWTRISDPFVEIYGYVNDGDDYKKFQTTVIDSNVNPEWNEEFIFDESECNGEYTKFVFKVYDSDDVIDGYGVLDADFLGETRPFETSSVRDCDEMFSEEMTLYRNDEQCGTLFVEISKDGCSDDNDGNDNENEKEQGGKNKRRLLFV